MTLHADRRPVGAIARKEFVPRGRSAGDQGDRRQALGFGRAKTGTRRANGRGSRPKVRIVLKRSIDERVQFSGRKPRSWKRVELSRLFADNRAIVRSGVGQKFPRFFQSRTAFSMSGFGLSKL